MNVKHVYIIGYPSGIGGANTELWHVCKLWRRFGLQVSLIPTWTTQPEWESRLGDIGCETIRGPRLELPAPAGAVCFSMCNAVFEHHAWQLQERDCRCVYMPCMNYLGGQLINHHQKWPTFDRYVFQSLFQLEQLAPQLYDLGVEQSQCYLVRGAFVADEEWPYEPREHNGEPFVVGRLSRPDPSKFAANTWEMFRDLRERIPGLKVRIMGWSAKVEAKCGPPPEWAECLPPNAEPPREFLKSLHCLIQANDRDRENMRAAENWPRVGLEAMAAGVPIVADRRGGWVEMIANGKTGYLGKSLNQIVGHATTLAKDEPRRERMIRAARRELEAQLACPETQWAAWQKVFEGLE